MAVAAGAGADAGARALEAAVQWGALPEAALRRVAAALGCEPAAAAAAAEAAAEAGGGESAANALAGLQPAVGGLHRQRRGAQAVEGLPRDVPPPGGLDARRRPLAAHRAQQSARRVRARRRLQRQHRRARGAVAPPRQVPAREALHRDGGAAHRVRPELIQHRALAGAQEDLPSVGGFRSNWGEAG
jgi:hypothetical protein